MCIGATLPGETLTEKPLDDRVTATKLPLPVSKPRLIAAVAASLVFPGLGHFILGKVTRAIVIGGGIAALFAFGFIMEGHFFKPTRGEWLNWFFSFLDMGIGLPYFVCYFLDLGFKVELEQAAKITYEYGNTFLMVAGALNMLATMDAYDIAIGRKE